MDDCVIVYTLTLFSLNSLHPLRSFSQLGAVRYCHKKGIVHRDLKLENFLFTGKEDEAELKLIDFGLSKHFECGDIHHEAVGTPYTVAPEVIGGSYSEKWYVVRCIVIWDIFCSGIHEAYRA